jgi:hypothetical protein
MSSSTASPRWVTQRWRRFSHYKGPHRTLPLSTASTSRRRAITITRRASCRPCSAGGRARLTGTCLRRLSGTRTGATSRRAI